MIPVSSKHAPSEFNLENQELSTFETIRVSRKGTLLIPFKDRSLQPCSDNNLKDEGKRSEPTFKTFASLKTNSFSLEAVFRARVDILGSELFGYGRKNDE